MLEIDPAKDIIVYQQVLAENAWFEIKNGRNVIYRSPISGNDFSYVIPAGTKFTEVSFVYGELQSNNSIVLGNTSTVGQAIVGRAIVGQ